MHADHAAHPPWLAHHFDTPEQQFSSAKLGMWAFLLTEVLFFSGLFCAYAVFRRNHPELFVDGHHFLNTILGAINTAVLLFSSFTMAWGVRCAQLGKTRGLTNCLIVTLLCAGVFLVIKYNEYHVKWEHSMVPGQARIAALFGVEPQHIENAIPGEPPPRGFHPDKKYIEEKAPSRRSGGRCPRALGDALPDSAGRTDQELGDVFRHLFLPDRTARRPRDLWHHRDELDPGANVQEGTSAPSITVRSIAWACTGTWST